MKKDKELKNLPLSVKRHIKHLERVRSDFIANVSHELRTPLTVIHGYLENLLKENEIDKKFLKKIYQQMYQHSIRMENIIDDLLLLSRLENEEINIAKSPVNITKMLKLLYEDAKIISGNKNQEISLKLDKQISINGSEEELKSLFYNLITNAIKYTPSHGKIEIECFALKKNVIFNIKDNGIGIAKKHIPRITERFYRVDKSRSRENGGTGLGLAIVKHVIMNHQGQFLVESEVGVGSTFTCVLPL